MGFLDVMNILIPNLMFYSAPLIFAALGGVFSERSGVVNIGLEGQMIVGAFVAIVFNLSYADSLGGSTPWIALLVAMFVGGVFSLLHAVATVSFRAEQIVSGLAINMLALGGSLYFVKKLYGAGQTPNIQQMFPKSSIPGLEKIPLIGEALFKNFYWTSWLAIVMAFVVWVVIYKTSFGLRLRAVGEHPMAADTMGVSVSLMRYLGVVLSGVFASLGGAVYSQTIVSEFTHSTISGQGFIALAALIFGKWHPLGATAAALFFGMAQSLSIIGTMLPVVKDIPQVYLLIFPYVLTILALAGFVGKADAPAAAGIPYVKGKR